MADQVRLTDRFIRALTTAEGRLEVWDEDIPGFGVRVSAEGRKTFVLLYRSPFPAGAPARERPSRRLSLGVYQPHPPKPYLLAQARQDARVALGQIARGIDPGGPPKKKGSRAPATEAPVLDASSGRDHSVRIWADPPRGGSFAALALEWYRLHALPNKRRLRDDEAMLPILLEAWGERAAVSITRLDVLTVTEPMVRRGADSRAEKLRLLVSGIYNWACRKTTLVDSNPAGAIAPLAKPGRGTRWLRERELAAWWQYLESRPAVVRAYLRVLVASLQRPGEVRHMEWAELDPKYWRIPGTKLGPKPHEVVGTKNELLHIVPLPSVVREWIEELRPITGAGRYVFGGAKEGQPLSAPNQLAQRSWQTLGLRWMPQDLRRTGATHMQRLGISEDLIDRIQNHLAPGVRRNYNMWAYLEERKKALELWAEELLRIARL